MPIFQLNDQWVFPPVQLSLEDGLLAYGGDLSVGRLMCAYEKGIFPWYSEEDPILWWSPQPRCILFPRNLHVSRSLKKVIKSHRFRVTFDTALDNVLNFCSHREEGTWLNDELKSSFKVMHSTGYVHSVEVWSAEGIAGGLYGVCIGRTFSGESMFHREKDASKVALYYLCKLADMLDISFIDCQVPSPHLLYMGAEIMDRNKYLQLHKSVVYKEQLPKSWKNYEDFFSMS